MCRVLEDGTSAPDGLEFVLRDTVACDVMEEMCGVSLLMVQMNNVTRETFCVKSFRFLYDNIPNHCFVIIKFKEKSMIIF